MRRLSSIVAVACVALPALAQTTLVTLPSGKKAPKDLSSTKLSEIAVASLSILYSSRFCEGKSEAHQTAIDKLAVIANDVIFYLKVERKMTDAQIEPIYDHVKTMVDAAERATAAEGGSPCGNSDVIVLQRSVGFIEEKFYR